MTAGALTIPVALGRGGILANKREGDGGTPRGSFRPRQLWWRADRHSRPKTFLPARTITGADAWCEDPVDRHYNQWIRRGQGEGGDRLKRDDHLYDFIIEIDHNTRPRIAGRGSAVFLHLARDNFGPTAGCVSMLSDSPPDRDVIWSDERVQGASRFVQRLWRLVNDSVDLGKAAPADRPASFGPDATALRKAAHALSDANSSRVSRKTWSSQPARCFT